MWPSAPSKLFIVKAHDWKATIHSLRPSFHSRHNSCRTSIFTTIHGHYSRFPPRSSPAAPPPFEPLISFAIRNRYSPTDAGRATPAVPLRPREPSFFRVGEGGRWSLNYFFVKNLTLNSSPKLALRNEARASRQREERTERKGPPQRF